jgi:calcineurin-like phosphoesterase family protein
MGQTSVAYHMGWLTRCSHDASLLQKLNAEKSGERRYLRNVGLKCTKTGFVYREEFASSVQHVSSLKWKNEKKVLLSEIQFATHTIFTMSESYKRLDAVQQCLGSTYKCYPLEVYIH